MGLMTRIADKTGALGSVVSAIAALPAFQLLSFGALSGWLEPVRGTVHAACRCLPRCSGERAGLVQSSAMAAQSARHDGSGHRKFAATVWLLGNWWTAT